MSNAAVVYCRFSTDRQDARSLDDQERRCREYAQRHGLNVVHVYADAAVSGAHTDRPQFQEMVQLAKSTRGRAFSVVIVDDLARLSRDQWDMGRIVFHEFAGLGVRVIDVMTGMASDEESARQLYAAIGMGNDLFLQMVKKETHRGLQGRALAGFWTGGRVYGFKTVPEPNPPDPLHPRAVQIIDEEQARVIVRIFERYATGHGLRHIGGRVKWCGIEHQAARRIFGAFTTNFPFS